MKEKLLEVLNKNKYSKDELIKMFSLDVTLLLDELVNSGEVIYYKNKYATSSFFNIYLAKITSIKDYFAFATIGDEDFYISKYNLNCAFLDDLVYIKKINDAYDDRYEVVDIIKRAREEVVGELKIIKGTFYLDVKDICLNDYSFIIKKSNISLIPHSIITAKIEKYMHSHCIVTPIEVLGLKSDPGIDISRIILNNNAPLKFSKSVLDEVKTIPDIVSQEEIIGRTDFRDRTIVTIDGDDAKDFDDAVEVQYINGLYHVGVHIADVSHYVKENSFIDKEAELRSTSIYASDRVVPMLPFELSNGICSLNPNVDRLVQSVLFSIDRDGNIISKSIHKGVINSSARLTYSYVNKLLNDNIVDNSLPKKVNKMIPLLKEVATIIRNKRESLGAVDVESNELKFELFEDGSVKSVSKRTQDVGELLIEDLMIQANEIIATIIDDKKLPFLYRIHENPKAKKMDDFKRLSSIMGYPCSFDSLSVTPYELQMHLDSINDENRKTILSSYLLRAMAKARYSPYNKGHFGLALQNYTHFTSPIRRYPDLLVHRLIDYYIFNIGEKKSNDIIFKELLFHGENTSIREKRAQTIERTIDDLLSAKYMKNFIGNKYNGKIISMTSNGMFVELDNGIEGYLPFENMTGYFEFRPDIFMASSKGKTYKLGDTINVRLLSVDIEKAKITFSLINEDKRSKMINKKGGHKNARRKKNHSK